MRFAVNTLYFYNDIPLKNALEKIKAAGFCAVEILFPYSVPSHDLKEWVAMNELEVSLIDVLPGDITKMDLNVAIDPARKDEFKKNAENALRYAGLLKTVNVNCLAGIIPEELSVSKGLQIETFSKNIEFLCNCAKGTDIRILVEPISRQSIPGYLLHDLHETVELLSNLNLDNLFLQFDFYHVQLEHGNLINNVLKYFDRIKYFQIANVPRRNEPDRGEINYPYIFSELKQLGYTGYIGLEYIPEKSMKDTFSWIAHR